MADLSFGAHAGLAIGSGLFALAGVALNSYLSRNARRAEIARDERREVRERAVAAYANCLALAAELDSRLDLFTPPPHELGDRIADVKLIEMLRAEGKPPPPEVAGRFPLVDSAALPGLKDLLARVTSTAASVEIVGSLATGNAARDLVRAQRYWLLSLERDDPSSAAEALAEARPLLASFRKSLGDDYRSGLDERTVD